MTDRDELEAMAARLAAHPDYRVLRRLDMQRSAPRLPDRRFGARRSSTPRRPAPTRRATR